MGREWVALGQTVIVADGNKVRSRVAAASPPASDFVPAMSTRTGIAEAKAGAESLAARLLSELNPRLADPSGAARNLIALSDGLTLQVLIGHLTAGQARECLRMALAELNVA